MGVCFLIFYSLFKPKKGPRFELTGQGWSVVGFLVGGLAILVGAVGPLIAPFFIRTDLRKEEVVATKATMQMSAHFIKIPVFLYLDFEFEQYAPMMIAMALAAVFGTRVGVALLKKAKENLFRRLYKSVLFVSGARLLWKVFGSY